MKIRRLFIPVTLGLGLIVVLLLGAGWQSATASPVSGEQPAVPNLPSAPLTAESGWTHSGNQDEWEWGKPSCSGGPLQCAPGSTEGCWVTDLDNTYNASSDQSLYSTIITLPVTATTPISVTWYQAWYLETSYENARAYYRCNDGAWTQMWAYSGGLYYSWQQVPGGPYDITCVPTDTLQLRFRLNSDSSKQYAGYYVDDVRVFDAAGHDLYVKDFEPQFRFIKQADRDVVGPGETLTYTLHVTNTGDGIATNTILTDTLDAFQRPQTVTTDQGSCTIVDSDWGGVVTCTLGTLAVGSTSHITLTAQAPTTFSYQGFQAITNTAEITGNGYCATAQTSLWLGCSRVRLVEGGDVTPYNTIQEAIDAASGVDSEVQVSGTFKDINNHGGWKQIAYIKIGRAAGRGRGENSGGAGSFKKKKRKKWG